MKWYRNGKLGASISRKIGDGNYGSFEAARWFEGEVDGETDLDKAGDDLEDWLSVKVDKSIKEFEASLGLTALEIVAPEVVEAVADSMEIAFPAEEKPPLPTDAVQQMRDVSQELGTTERDVAEAIEEVRVPIDDAGNELKSFVVKSIEIAETRGGDKFGKVYGGPWKREWIPAWADTMDALFGNIENMDLGMVLPPYAVKALVKMGEYKNRPSPDSVVEWKRTE